MYLIKNKPKIGDIRTAHEYVFECVAAKIDDVVERYNNEPASTDEPIWDTGRGRPTV
jgi:hypothetical protein